MKSDFVYVSLVALTLASVLSCGVEGPPQPPLTPAQLGHGKPTFQRATEGFRFKDVPPVPSETPKPNSGSEDK